MDLATFESIAFKFVGNSKCPNAEHAKRRNRWFPKSHDGFGATRSIHTDNSDKNHTVGARKTRLINANTYIRLVSGVP